MSLSPTREREERARVRVRVREGDASSSIETQAPDLEPSRTQCSPARFE